MVKDHCLFYTPREVLMFFKSLSESFSSARAVSANYQTTITDNEKAFNEYVFGKGAVGGWLQHCSRAIQNHVLAQRASAQGRSNVQGSLPNSAYYTDNGYDLLKYIRNQEVHYYGYNTDPMRQSINNDFGTRPRSFLEYFTRRFPNLVTASFTISVVLDTAYGAPNAEILRRSRSIKIHEGPIHTSDLFLSDHAHPPYVYDPFEDETDS